MLSRARLGVCEIVAGAALWRCRCRSRGRRSILCIWVCVCVAGVAFGRCLEGQDVVARAAGGVRNRGRRSTLAMPLPKSWQAQHSVHLGVCLCGRGSIRQLTHSHSLTLTHSLTHAHSHSLTHTHSHSLTLIHSLTHSLAHSLTHTR